MATATIKHMARETRLCTTMVRSTAAVGLARIQRRQYHRPSRPRGVGFVPQTLEPQVEREYVAAGISYRPYDVHREGNRLCRRMRELFKNWYVPAEKKYIAHVTPWQLFDAGNDG